MGFNVCNVGMTLVKSKGLMHCNTNVSFFNWYNILFCLAEDSIKNTPA